MRKQTFLLILSLLLTCIGNAAAHTLITSFDQLTDGDYIYLYTPSTSTSNYASTLKYFSISSRTSDLTDANLFKIEMVDASAKTFRLQQKSTGLYLPVMAALGNNSTNSTIGTGKESVDEAAVFTFELYSEGASMSDTELASVSSQGTEALVRLSLTVGSTKAYINVGPGATSYWSGTGGFSVWLMYKYEEAKDETISSFDNLSDGDYIYLYTPSSKVTDKPYFCSPYRTSDLTDANYFKVEIVDESAKTFKLQQKSTGYYLPAASKLGINNGEDCAIGDINASSDNAAVFTFEKYSEGTALTGTELISVSSATPDDLIRLATTIAGSKAYINVGGEKTTYWTGTGAYSVWLMYKLKTEQEITEFTYNVKDPFGNALFSKTGIAIVGEGYPDLGLPEYDFCTYVYPEGTVKEGETSADVTLSYNYPFTVSENRDNPVWHFMQVGDVNDAEATYGIIYDSSDTNIYYTPLEATRTAWSMEDTGDLWCFVGDPYNGFKIYNGNSDKLLVARTELTGDGSANYAVAYSEAFVTASTTLNYLWDFTKSELIDGVNGFFITMHEQDNAPLRKLDDTWLGFNTNTEAGVYSTFSVYTDITSLPLNAAGDGQSYSTLYLPYEAKVAGEATKVYTGTVSGAEMIMSELEDGIIPANTGVLLVNSEAAESVELTLSSTSAQAPQGNALLGTNKAIEGVTKTDYLVFGKGSQGVGFYTPNSTTLKANRAYVLATEANGLNALALNFSGVASAIDTATSATLGSENATIYDLQGRRVTRATRGLYIVGGKKVLVK